MTIALPRPRSLPGLFLLVGVLSLGSCRTEPVVESVAAKAPPPLMRLCGSPVAAEEGAVQAEVLRHVALGMPVEEAADRMKALGYSCLYAGNLVNRPKKSWGLSVPRTSEQYKYQHTLFCHITANEVGNWGCHSYPLTVMLRFDERAAITQVEVEKIYPRNGRHASFFERQPDLREPTGMPVEQAWALMTAHHFFCKDVQPPDREGGRPYLSCCAYDEGLLGSDIIRVHLYYDAARTVTETEVLQKGESLDWMRSLLPNPGDNRGRQVAKIIVLPVRVSAIVALVGVGVTLCACLRGGGP